MRTLGRAILLVILLVGLGSGFAAWRTLEFGSRPPTSIVELETDPTVKFIKANGIRFGYLEQGEGPLILLFHGYPETARSWSKVQRNLASAGYRVVAPFMRGYPPSAFSENQDYRVATLGDDVIALIDALGAEKAIIVGHDWGASAVYRAAITHPEKVEAMVALAIPHPMAIAGDLSVLLGANHFIYYQLPIARRLVWSHDFAHIEWIYNQWSPTYDPPSEELADIKSTLRVPGAIDGILGYYWSFFAPNDGPPIDPATKIAVPALVIGGEADGTLDIARFEMGAEGFADRYEFVPIANVGHFPQLEAPNDVSKAILSFLSRQE